MCRHQLSLSSHPITSTATNGTKSENFMGLSGQGQSYRGPGWDAISRAGGQVGPSASLSRAERHCPERQRGLPFRARGLSALPRVLLPLPRSDLLLLWSSVPVGLVLCEWRGSHALEAQFYAAMIGMREATGPVQRVCCCCPRRGPSAWAFRQRQAQESVPCYFTK